MEDINAELDHLKNIARKRREGCDNRVNAYTSKIFQLSPSNLVLVVGASLLSLVAGASLFVEQGIIDKKTAGFMAILSSGFTIIHKEMKCDQYQSECKRLKVLFEGLSSDYTNLEIETEPKEYKSKLEMLNNEYSKIIKGAKINLPSQGYLKSLGKD